MNKKKSRNKHEKYAKQLKDKVKTIAEKQFNSVDIIFLLFFFLDPLLLFLPARVAENIIPRACWYSKRIISNGMRKCQKKVG